jgi:hypothetical protein
VLLKQVWTSGAQAHSRLSTLVWCAGWAIPLAVLVLAISVPFWRTVVAEAEQAMAQQIDYEDGALCAKFGFAAGTENYLSCKLDLADLRRNHEKLLAAGSTP